MEKLLRRFENAEPEIVFEWKDHESEAEGWVVINSLRGGAAGGGTRMRKGLNRREVESLAKTMEVKFTVSGPPIGGAKSGINFDPQDPRKEEVLKRWYKAVFPLLKNYYGTGGDMNVDEIDEVIPITEDYGLWHPQEGVVNGFFRPNESQKIQKIGLLRLGVSKIVEDPRYTPCLERKYKVADLITGYGVAESVSHFYRLWGGDIKGKRAIIQGWGNVGAAAGYYLSQSGAKIVGIIDKQGAVINTDGYSFEEVRELINRRIDRKLTSEDLIPFEVAKDKIWNMDAEIFVPAAGSRLVTKEQIEKMAANGLEVISCGANVPFADEEIFFGSTLAFADSQVAVIPDFIANCGMARVFAYLMEGNKEVTDESVFGDTSITIETALKKIHDQSVEKRCITKSALEISISQLV
ncbi:Glu/Leu/Phe/Val dehydrogenase dimerization domain-containing protein [Fulvivirgaceae bacterium BMA10]|uniref:Glu/Leu/Phe/Val dehydrogenase dimerization domain-containing protein n=1 Tax=Splendidivirga corallicola TaxID=3051826 RepID=A0ABT8KKB7_9BACT|nr:Glu/Leu/Phe/Val dehydrogenase dimerization domain-containing protein [Fulvivirgaceae bacterium BMA10]